MRKAMIIIGISLIVVVLAIEFGWRLFLKFWVGI